MKKKNLLFFPFLFALGIGLFSCNIGNTGNVSNYTGYLAVAVSDYNTGGILLGTPQFGYLLAPELTNLKDGDCVLLNQFTIDSNQQTSTQYYTATNVIATGISHSAYEQSDTVVVGDYTLPISSVTGILSCEFYQGKFFVTVNCNDGNPAFRLVYKDNEDGADGTKNFYLLAKSSGTSSSNSGVTYAFDVLPLVQMGQDTTIQNVNYRYISANLKYISSISDGAPTYSQIQGSFIIPIFFQ